MMSLIGDETDDVINLPNGMIIHIDYGDKNLDSFGVTGRYLSKHRRVRLFDKKHNIVSELIEENPHKENIPKYAISHDDKNVII